MRTILLVLLLLPAAALAAASDRSSAIDELGTLTQPPPSDRSGLMDQMRDDRRRRDVDRRIEERERAARLRNTDAERLRQLNELRDERNRIDRGRP